MKYNALYGQSGGPTAIINSSLYGVIKECEKNKKHIDTLFIMRNGIGGLINNDLVNVKTLSKKEIDLLPYTPSAICGSIRKKLNTPSLEDKEYQKILKTLKENNIRYIFLNGGNDSMDTALKLAKFFELASYEGYVIGVPKTIDNDLVHTDHTPGFGSAAKFLANTMKCLTYDNNCYTKGRVNIVEIMGRDAGWLTASSVIAKKDGCGPDLVYVPETNFSIDEFLKDVEKIYKKKQRVLVAISEGIHDKDGNLILPNTKSDAFNHAQLGGVGLYLSQIVEEKLNISTRAIELSLLQRSFAPLISKNDQIEAIRCGEYAVKFALQHKTCVMVTMIRENTKNNKYKIKYGCEDINNIANKVKYLNKEFINKKHNNINDNFIDYISPLIAGKVDSKEIDGLHQFTRKF